MVEAAQTPLLTAAQVAQEAHVQQASNGIFYASFGETQIAPEDLERIVQAVPAAIANALTRRAWYFVPLAIGEDDETSIASAYNIDLGDRAICHRNVSFGSSECIFISTRLMQDRFALAFEFFINVGHQFVDAVGVPASFSDLAWSQVKADVRGETSQDAWENRRRARERGQTSRRTTTPHGPELVPTKAGSRSTKRPSPPTSKPPFPTPSPSTCSRSPSTSTTPSCASANTRSSPRPRSPSASATSPDSSRPTPATNSRSGIGGGDKVPGC